MLFHRAQLVQSSANLQYQPALSLHPPMALRQLLLLVALLPLLFIACSSILSLLWTTKWSLKPVTWFDFFMNTMMAGRCASAWTGHSKVSSPAHVFRPVLSSRDHLQVPSVLDRLSTRKTASRVGQTSLKVGP